MMEWDETLDAALMLRCTFRGGKWPTLRALGMLGYFLSLLRGIGASRLRSLATRSPKSPGQMWLCQQDFMEEAGGGGGAVIGPILTDGPNEVWGRKQVIPLLEELRLGS